MKKLFLLISITVLCFSFAFAHNDFMKKSGDEAVPADISNMKITTNEKDDAKVVNWEWVTEPYSITTSWYDYMPSSYEGYPLRLQHNGDGGLYYTWHGTPDDGATTNRRQYWAYINAADGSLVDWGTISTQDVWQGYGSIDTHPESGAGIATWHQEDATLGYGTTMTYDSYIFSTPGFWTSYLFIPPDEPGGNEYIWPYVWVGPAPSPDSVRVYQTAKNYKNLDIPDNPPCEDTRIMYCDVPATADPADLGVLLDLSNWTIKTPMFYWRDKATRPLSQCFTIDPNIPGHISIIGYASWLDGDLGDMPVNQGMFVWDSWDYGETWDEADLHSSPTTEEYFYTVENLAGLYNDDQVFDEAFVRAIGLHNNARFDSNGNLHWPYMQQYYHPTDPGFYTYSTLALPPAETVWDGDTFTYREVPEMPYVDSLSGHTFPWTIDPATGDTLVEPTVAWSTYPDPATDAAMFHENTMKNAVNVDNDWMVQMWADGTYITLNDLGEPGYEDYVNHPIIYLSASNDMGNTWSEPIKITDIFDSGGNQTQFYDQITVYPYLSNEIEDLGNDWGKVHFSYMNDNSFGSFIHGAGQNSGGQIMYGSLKIDFGFDSVDNPHNVDVSSVELQNSPNPFNGSTTISFNAPQELRNVEVKIYNTKGQLVRTLNPGNNNEVTWYGKDSNNNYVSNGIYFYKLETAIGSVSNKMLLTR